MVSEELFVRQVAQMAPPLAPDDEYSKSDEYGRIWLYMSGGGLRSAVGSLGVVYFLTQPWAGADAWRKVTRIGSVSGGSLENAALAQARRDLPTHFWSAFERFTSHGSTKSYAWSLVRLVIFAVVMFLAIASMSTLDLPSHPVGRVAVVVSLVLAGCGIALAGVQLVLTRYLADRIKWITSPHPRGSESTDVADRLHVFATTDMRSGLPLHMLTMRRSTDGVEQRVMAHDRMAERNRIDFFEASELGVQWATFGSAAWPFLVLPNRARLRWLSVDVARDPARPFQVSQLAPEDDRVDTPFAPMDGGLTGTLGSRLDPKLFDAPGIGLMDLVSFPGDDGSDGRGASRLAVPTSFDTAPPEPAASSPGSAVRRIVVDGGQYLTVSRSSWLASVPGFSAFKTTHRAMKIALDNQITVDRAHVRDNEATWYVGVTGHGRHFQVRARSANVSDNINVVLESVDSSSGKRLRRVRRRPTGILAVVPGEDSPDVLVAAAIIGRLRLEADKLGLLFKLVPRGLAAGASGVAGAFSEAQGIGDNVDELRLVLRGFERSVLQAGRLDYVLGQQFAVEVLAQHGVAVPVRPAEGYRWPELDKLHERSGPGDPFGPGRPFAVSHRGDTGNGDPDNTFPAFALAYDKGFRVFECDAQLTKDDQLVALHGFLGTVGRPGSVWGRRRVGAMTLDDLTERLGYRPPTIEHLIESFEDVTWNIEAKRKGSMAALVTLLDAMRSDGRLGQPPIVSGGWSKRRLRQARENNSSELTAAHWREMLRLWLGFGCVPHVAVLQLPSWTHRIFRRMVRRAGTQRIQVHWFGANNGERIVKHLISDGGVGLITDEHDQLRSLLPR